jgi:hypothetical protein
MTLKYFIEKNGMNAEKSLNLLQSHGIISDNVIELSEVATADFTAAIRFLSGYIPCSLCGKPRRECHC